jgi:hypothetical protein
LSRAAIVLLLVKAATSWGASSEAPDDRPWYPRTLTGPNGEAVIHAPQIDAWQSFQTITGWVAFQVTQADSDLSYHGSLKFSARTDTDIAAREVLLHDIEVLELAIDGLSEDADEYTFIRDGFAALTRKAPLDLILAYLPHDVPLPSTEGLNPEPPVIFVSESPALLLFVDGEPRFLPVEGTDLQFVLNTTWDLLRSNEDGPLYLCYEGHWLTARTLDDTWEWATDLPRDFGKIPQEPNWTGVHDCLPANLRKLDDPEIPEPVVFYSSEAAELLQTDGPAAWSPIGETGLSYAENTEQELFRVGDEYFLLLSGRWFSSPGLDGPWILVTELPVQFQDIPAEDSESPHAKSYVRSSIPGTEEAWEAALIASIPRKAEIQRGSESELDIAVDYAGEPAFSSIEDTGIELALNTSYQVLRYEGIYYLCHNATWLTGFSPTGPWQFADSIPDQFALIPPSSPAYNTTFVTVDGSNDEAVYYAYKSGYEGAYVSDETVVQGTGYSAPAVSVSIGYMYSSGYPYPYYPYYWWPPTYGYGSWYDPNTGRYGEAVVGYGPYGAAGGAAVYNPETGVYGRGQAVWDNDEFAGRGFAYNPNTDTSIARNRYIDFEDNEGWSQRVAQRGDEWRYTQSQWEDGRMVTEFDSSRGTEGTVVRERDGDTVTSEGTISRGDEQASFETTREREGDAIVSEGTITGDERSATFDSVIDDGTYSGNIDGSEGGSGTIDRQLEDGEITGGSTFTKDGKTIESDVTRTAEGVQREFETSGGGQGVSQRSGDSNQFVYQSGSGDVYAGRDGNVYQRTDEGWSQVQNPGSRGTAASEGSFESRERAATSVGTQGAPIWASGGDQRSSRDGYSRSQGQYSRDLNRDYQSRQRGYDRYQRHQSYGNRPRRRRR